MTAPKIIAKWSTWGPYLQSVLRVVAASMFILPARRSCLPFRPESPLRAAPSR